MAKVLELAPIQGKLKAKITFDPTDKKGITFVSYCEDMEEYFDEFLISYILTEDMAAYSGAETDEKALKLYNMKIAHRFIYESLFLFCQTRSFSLPIQK
jgi:hypothetical protein